MLSSLRSQPRELVEVVRRGVCVWGGEGGSVCVGWGRWGWGGSVSVLQVYARVTMQINFLSACSVSQPVCVLKVKVKVKVLAVSLQRCCVHVACNLFQRLGSVSIFPEFFVVDSVVELVTSVG
jgi:hypothetical protein